jgi:hypothetical protein
LFFSTITADEYDIPWTYTTRATTNEQVPYGSGGTGAGYCDIVLNYNGVYANPYISGTIVCVGLSSGATWTAAHIHGAGTTGYYVCGVFDATNVIASLGNSGTFNVSITSTSYLSSMKDGETYVNIHTTMYAGGEVRANLIDMFATFETGQNPLQRAANPGVYIWSNDNLYSGYRPSFSIPFFCGGTVPATTNCTGGLDYYVTSDDTILNARCYGLAGNLTKIMATSTDSGTSSLTYLYDTDPICKADNRFQYRISSYNSDMDSLCQPDNTPPTGLNFTFWGDSNVLLLSCIVSPMFQTNGYGCPLKLNSTTPAPPFGVFQPVFLPPGTAAPTGTPTSGGLPTAPTSSGGLPTAPTAPTSSGGLPTAPTGGTTPSAAFNLPGTFLFTLFFTILSLWLN